MNIIIFGSTDLTQAVADFLFQKHYSLSAIVTVPSVFKISYKPEGVQNSRFVDLESWATARQIPIIVYENVSQLKRELLKLGELNLGLAVGWYHMIPPQIRSLFTLSCLGFHASLLPKLRGGAPLSWAILTKQKETGVSLFELGEGVDDGLLFAQEKFPIYSSDCVTDLVKKSESSIINILKKTFPKISRGKIKKYKQKGIPSYCGQRTPEDSLIDWTKSNEEILRLIRATAKPYAGAYSFLLGNKITIWQASIFTDLEIYGTPGQIVYQKQNSHIVACGKGALEIHQLESPINIKTHLCFSMSK